jgi:hypothetical protein
MPAGTITRVAGTGVAGDTGDDGPAVDAELTTPIALAATADGGFLIADGDASVVRKVAVDHQITRVAGTGVAGNSGDDGPAVDAQLQTPVALAATRDGGFLVADWFESVVRKVSPDGIITRVAGTGVAGDGGDDGPAVDAQLQWPMALAVTADGGFLIADARNRKVRKVSSDGTITRVAGTGVFGNSGDDGPAVDAQLKFPVALAVTADGGFLIADSASRVVRKVSPVGEITRVAGTGTAGNTGDDGSATDAQLNRPRGLASTADDGFLIADLSACVVRLVAADGRITRVAGTGVAGNSGDDGPATNAELNLPCGLLVAAAGFLIADAGNSVVREVSTA